MCSIVSNSLWPYGLNLTMFLCLWDFPAKDTGVGCYFLLQGIFPTQGSYLYLLHLLTLAGKFFNHWATWDNWRATCKRIVGDLPDGPVVKTLCFHCSTGPWLRATPALMRVPLPSHKLKSALQQNSNGKERKAFSLCWMYLFNFWHIFIHPNCDSLFHTHQIRDN